MKPLALFFFIFFGGFAFGQDATLLPEQYIDWVIRYHPVIGQNERARSIAESEIRRNRGSFDPVLSGSVQNKNFDQKEYYFLGGGALTVPTNFGPQFEMGYDQNRGEFLNPQNDLPESGLWYLGVEVPLLQGLLTDERRTAVRIAESEQEITDQEIRQAVNELLYKAQKAYWEWSSAYAVWITRRNAEVTSFERYSNTIRSFEEGFKPAIDTLESSIQWQNRRLLRQEAQKTYVYAQLEASTFVWDSLGTPLILADSIRPITLESMFYALSPEELALNIDSLQNIHPQWQAFGSQLDLLRFEQRLKNQKILPKANLRYDLLQDAQSLGNEGPDWDFGSNYWSLKVEIPIFLRSERFAANQARFKVEQTDLKRSESWNKTRNYWRGLRNELLVLTDQISQYSITVEGYLNLLQAETVLFFSGESSLFVVNSRELKWLEAQEKLIELRQKYRVKKAQWYLTGGLTPLQP